jgi:hypothetical protein
MTTAGAKRTFVASNHERVTNGTMARSSARRSIKEKAGGHYAGDLVLQTAGEVERRRNNAKAIVNPMTIRVCTPPITGPGLCFLLPDGHGHERLSESASRKLARSRQAGSVRLNDFPI